MVESSSDTTRDYSKRKKGTAWVNTRLKPFGEAVEQEAKHFFEGFRDDQNWEDTGAWLSARFGSTFDRIVERRVKKFAINIRNEQNLEVLRGQSHVIVANHPYPQDRISIRSGISPDSAVLAFIIREATGENVHFLGNYGEKAAPFIKDWPEKWQKRWKRTHKGIMKGYGMLSYNTTPGAVPRDFVVGAKRMLSSGESVFIYPWGPWHEDDVITENTERGAAFVARGSGVPILPIYIHGARTWRPGEKATVVVGVPFMTEGLTDLEVQKKIGQEITGLKQTIQTEPVL